MFKMNRKDYLMHCSTMSADLSYPPGWLTAHIWFGYWPLTLTVVSLMKLAPLHHTTHWYVVWSSLSLRHTVSTDVWCWPSDCRDVCSLISSVTRKALSDFPSDSARSFNLNHFTFSSLCVAPWMVHLRSHGKWAYTMPGWPISDTLGGAVERNML